jgi:uncharacterized protein (DUF1800 family)
MGGGDPAKRPGRRELLEYYRENGLELPQKLLQELQSQKLMRAVYSERQLQEVMTDFWFNHFNVFWGKGADRFLTTDFEMNAIRPHALARFKDLVRATAKSPAMLFYLDNHLSSSPDAAVTRRARARRPSGINENYARELMELHTLGVDGGYTEKDVFEVARAFTGWTINQQRRAAAFIFRPQMHDNAEKVVLGQRIPAGGGIRDGEAVIEILTSSPSTARFISTKLVRRFVNETPPQSLVDRVTNVYMKTDGDIRAMLRTILTSPEFYSPEAYRSKIKTPLELVASAIRALEGETDGSGHLARTIARMGQPLYQYQPPTGFPDRAEHWINSGTLLARLNFGVALSANQIPGTRVDLKRLAPDDWNNDAVIDLAVRHLLAGEISADVRKTLQEQMRSAGGDVLTKTFALVLGSPDFQKR